MDGQGTTLVFHWTSCTEEQIIRRMCRKFLNKRSNSNQFSSPDACFCEWQCFQVTKTSVIREDWKRQHQSSYQWTFQTWNKFLSFSLFLIVNLPSPSAKMKKHLFIFKYILLIIALLLWGATVQKCPIVIWLSTPNRAHMNSKPYSDDLLFIVLRARVRSTTMFNMFHVPYINQVYNIFKKHQQVHLDLWI